MEENLRFEKEAPYNFCDRWCERCVDEKQARCRLYQDEFEQRTTCIAYGKDPDDAEITKEVIEKQFEGVDEKLQQFMEENEIDFDDIDDSEYEKREKHLESIVKNNPLNITARQYLKKAGQFLKKTFYKKEGVSPELVYDFEAVAWYHTLLPVKLYRALRGFNDYAAEDEFALHDAVAQFSVCKKSINESVKALGKISPHYPDNHKAINELLVLLHDIFSRIQHMEESI